MARPSRIPLTRHNIRLRAGDLDYLGVAYYSRSVPANEVIRRLVAAHVDTLRRSTSPADITVALEKESTE